MHEDKPVHPEFLDMQHVDVSRGGDAVLHDINLAIRTGEHVAILGPNGCGKSTLIKTMTSECYPIIRPGLVRRIYGQERWDLTELRKHLGVVSVELPGERTPMTTGLNAVISGFFSSSTIWPNLAVTQTMKEEAIEALRLLEALHLRDRWVGTMSAGETRRVMIARALVNRPATLLLDEPSNGLDLAAQRGLREILRALARNTERKTGIVMVTHNLGDILPEISRVVMIKDGRIFADGPKESLLAHDRLRALFGVDLDVARRDGYWYSW